MSHLGLCVVLCLEHLIAHPTISYLASFLAGAHVVAHVSVNPHQPGALGLLPNWQPVKG